MIEEHQHKECDLIMNRLNIFEQKLDTVVAAKIEREMMGKLWERAKAGLLIFLQIVGGLVVLLEVVERIKSLFKG